MLLATRCTSCNRAELMQTYAAAAHHWHETVPSSYVAPLFSRRRRCIAEWRIRRMFDGFTASHIYQGYVCAQCCTSLIWIYFIRLYIYLNNVWLMYSSFWCCQLVLLAAGLMCTTTVAWCVAWVWSREKDGQEMKAEGVSILQLMSDGCLCRWLPVLFHKEYH